MRAWVLTLMKTTVNIGDHYTNPLDYFFLPDAEKVEMNDALKDPRLSEGVIIIGGGGHVHIPAPDYNNGRFGHLEDLIEKNPNIITWGTGHNVHGGDKIEFPDYFDSFILNGVRDQGTRLRWVPCVSCMHKVFDRNYKAPHSFVVYEHGGYPIPINNYPKRSNHNGTIEEAVSFLASGKTVITNSWHGAYWGLLLGRKVVVYQPFSTKFLAIINDEKEIKMLKPAKGQDRMFLTLCRETNMAYYKEVLEKL